MLVSFLFIFIFRMSCDKFMIFGMIYWIILIFLLSEIDTYVGRAHNQQPTTHITTDPLCTIQPAQNRYYVRCGLRAASCCMRHRQAKQQWAAENPLADAKFAQNSPFIASLIFPQITKFPVHSQNFRCKLDLPCVMREKAEGETNNQGFMSTARPKSLSLCRNFKHNVTHFLEHLSPQGCHQTRANEHMVTLSSSTAMSAKAGGGDQSIQLSPDSLGIHTPSAFLSPSIFPWPLSKTTPQALTGLR